MAENPDTSGGLSLRDEIVRFVDANPGASTAELLAEVGGGRGRVRSAVDELAAEGLLENRGRPNRHAWHLVGEPPAPRSWREVAGMGPGPEPGELEGLEGLRMAEEGDACAGWAVSAWLTPAQADALVDVSTRQLRRLEDKGLPARGGGRGREKLYPLPHLLHWLAVYRAFVEQDRKVEWLPYDVAALRVAELDGLTFCEEEEELRVR